MTEEYETYEEVSTSDSSIEDITAGDICLILGLLFVGCFVIGFILRSIRKTFKSFHVKVGNKLEIGAETKDKE